MTYCPKYIGTSLRSSDDIQDRRCLMNSRNLLTTSFRLNIPLKNEKRFYRSTKYQLIAKNCLWLKLTQGFGPNLMLTLRGLTSEQQCYRTLSKGVECYYCHCE